MYNQKAGQGFSLTRVGTLISLSCGAILSLGFCRYAGKGHGEVCLLRRIWDILRQGDFILGNCLMSNWAGSPEAIDVPMSQHHARRADHTRAAPVRSSSDQRTTATSSSSQSLADRHLTEYNPDYCDAIAKVKDLSNNG